MNDKFKLYAEKIKLILEPFTKREKISLLISLVNIFKQSLYTKEERIEKARMMGLASVKAKQLQKALKISCLNKDISK